MTSLSSKKKEIMFGRKTMKDLANHVKKIAPKTMRNT